MLLEVIEMLSKRIFMLLNCFLQSENSRQPVFFGQKKVLFHREYGGEDSQLRYP